MDVMTLVARLGLDSSEYEKGLKEASGGLKGLGKNLKGLMTAAAKGAAGAIAAGATAVTVLTKSAVSAYGEYEQLVGGVETLFGRGSKALSEYANGIYEMGQRGEDVRALQEELIRQGYDLGSAGVDGIFGPKTQAAFEAYKNAAKGAGGAMVQAQDLVLENAWKAFETAGLSANEYMATVTSFSASLLQSLGGDTEKAARYADMAVIDMSDNANKMGTDISAIQVAYAGFAKQNYTMLKCLAA